MAGLIERFNKCLKAGSEPLYAPDIKFNRAIGKYAGQKFHARTGEPLSDRENEQHKWEVTPNDDDKKTLLEIINNDPGWIVRKTGAKDPLATIAEPRKMAINI